MKNESSTELPRSLAPSGAVEKPQTVAVAVRLDGSDSLYQFGSVWGRALLPRLWEAWQNGNNITENISCISKQLTEWCYPRRSYEHVTCKLVEAFQIHYWEMEWWCTLGIVMGQPVRHSVWGVDEMREGRMKTRGLWRDCIWRPVERVTAKGMRVSICTFSWRPEEGHRDDERAKRVKKDTFHSFPLKRSSFTLFNNLVKIEYVWGSLKLQL